MKQTEEFKEMIERLKEVVKISSVLNKSSTYMKLCGVDFNGEYYGNLTDLDQRRLRELAGTLKSLGAELDENLDRKS